MPTSDTPAVPPRGFATQVPGGAGGLPAQSRGGIPPSGLDRFNAASPPAAEAALLACCGSRRWALRLATHRPYPDLDALLAAADEASYDLTPADLAEALVREASSDLRQRGPHGQLLGDPAGSAAQTAAQTALRAAHAAYESRFGHAFVICLDGLRPDELLDHVLVGIRARLGHEVEQERSITADELRRTARGRLVRLVTDHPESRSFEPPDSPYVPL
jgi:2-oxo-4-hydroxy-4-carboxy-5-ureidoimidazoline decarboxylase